MEILAGDIVLFESNVAGKAKFHFCFFFNSDADVYSLMLLNSEGEYEDHFAIDANRLPNMPPSRTGRSIFSCPTVIRRSPEQLARLRPVKRCTLPRDVAVEFLAYASSISAMTKNDKNHLIETLKSLCE